MKDPSRRPGRRAVLIVLTVLVAALPSAALAQPTTNAAVSGFVRDDASGEGLIRATVRVQGYPLGGLTNERGYYVVPKLPVGEHVVEFSYIGYATERRSVQVVAGADIRLDVRLRPEAILADEIIVHGDSMRTSEILYRKPISQVQLSAAQISAVPQVAEADLLRSLQSLPGVLPLSDFSSALYIRGGTPDQNLYLVDGTDVYNPEHAFGIFSTFNTDAIKQADLSKGGFGAQYGGRLSSVLNVTNLDGNREEFEGTASLSLLSAKTTLQMPIGDRGSLSGSIRRTYFDQTVGKSLDDIPDYYFYDGNVKAFFELTDRDHLTVSYYAGRDFLDIIFNPDATEEQGIEVDWGNKTGSLRWTRVITPTLFADFYLTGSRFTSDFSLPIVDLTERNLVTDVTLKGNLEHHHSDHLTTLFGFEQKMLHVRFKQDFPEGLIDVDHEPRHSALFAQTNWRPSESWDIEAGLRLNRFDNTRTFTHVGPRLAAKHRLTRTTNLRAAGGVYYQYLHRIPRFIATDIWIASNPNQDASQSRHAIVGVQQELDGDWQLEVEGYWKGYDQILQFNQTFLTELEASGYDENDYPFWNSTKGLFNTGDGSSRGVEIMLRKDEGSVTGWLAYTLGSTDYTFADLNSGRDFAPRHDRTQVVNLVANVDVANAWKKARGIPRDGTRGHWRLSFNFIYGSGQPITEPGSHYFTKVHPYWPINELQQAPTVINGVRLPAYSRLDVSLTWRKDYGSWSMAPYVQLFNAGNRSNVWFIEYEFRNNRPDISAQHMFPLLPTLGVTFTF